jgi:hypothetical protein
MGRAKEWMMEQDAREFDKTDSYICAKCLTDKFLKQYIRNHSVQSTCDYCGKKSKKNIAAEFDGVMRLIMDGINFYWHDPGNEIAYDGGYQADTKDTEDILHELGITENDKVFRDIEESIRNTQWIEREYYYGTEDEIMSYGWTAFREAVLHRSRYLFLASMKDKCVSAEISPADFLDRLAYILNNKLEEFVVHTITKNKIIFRVRKGKERYTTAKSLGTPPSQDAILSNRMSPAGISMFYGSFDKETAIIESGTSNNDANIVSIGTFLPLRPLRLLNLYKLPDIPSVFDSERQQLIYPLRFLKSFSYDIAQPIERDGREHIDYVPSQIVTEYFRHIYRTNSDKQLDGILYKSAKNESKSSCVLFLENHQASDQKEEKKPEHILRLVKVEHN